jgi:hypothetical protein
MSILRATFREPQGRHSDDYSHARDFSAIVADLQSQIACLLASKVRQYEISYDEIIQFFGLFGC